MSSPPRVLFVDDNQDMCELVELGFGFAGFKVTTCRSVSEARAALEQGEFDVVLSDLHLAVGDNTQALIEHVRVRCPNARLLVVTGDREHDDLGDVDGVLYKPVDLDDLIAVVEAAESGPG